MARKKKAQVKKTRVLMQTHEQYNWTTAKIQETGLTLPEFIDNLLKKEFADYPMNDVEYNRKKAQ